MSDEKEAEEKKIQPEELCGQKLYKSQEQLIVYEDGKTDKTKMFDFLEIPLDDYTDLTFTETQLKRIRMHFQNMQTGIQAMAPIFCGGAKCPFIKRCPLFDRTKEVSMQNYKEFPLMRQCPFERGHLNWQRRRYVEEFDVDVCSPSEMGMVNKLAELDLYDYRVTLLLAHGDKGGDGQDLTKTQVTGKDLMGKDIKRLEIHPAWELKQKIHRQKMEILESLVGTRKEKYKREAALKQREGNDPSTVQSDLRKKLENLRNVTPASEEIIDAEFTEHPKENDK
jgi:hypothetical protein